MDSRELGLPSAFLDLLEDWKATVKTWTKALRTINTQLIELYWAIGQGVRRQQEPEGSGVMKRLSEDLRQEFPNMKGLSPRNIQPGQLSPRCGPTGHIMVPDR